MSFFAVKLHVEPFLLTSRTVRLTDETGLTASVMCCQASFFGPDTPVCTLEN